VSGSTTKSGASSTDSTGGESDRFCATIGCIQFFRDPQNNNNSNNTTSRPNTVTMTSNGSTRRLRAPTALQQRRMTLPSLQNQMQAIIRLQAWWRMQLAMQHYRTMKVCRHLLQQLQLQSSSAYPELQHAVAALHLKTQQQMQLQEKQQQQQHSPTKQSTGKAATATTSEEKKEEDNGSSLRLIQVKSSEEMSSSQGEDASCISESPVLLMAKKQIEKTIAVARKHRHDRNSATKDVLALNTIYALPLALENTAPDSQVLFSRQELLSPHNDIIRQERARTKSAAKREKRRWETMTKKERLDNAQQQGGRTEQVQEEHHRPWQEEVFHSPQQHLLQSTEGGWSAHTCSDDDNTPLNHPLDLASDEDDSIVYNNTVGAADDSSSGVNDNPDEVKSSASYGLLRFFGLVQDRTIDEEVYQNDNYHDVDQEGDDVIKELDELLEASSSEAEYDDDAVEQPNKSFVTAFSGGTNYQLTPTTGSPEPSNYNQRSCPRITAFMPRLYSQGEQQVAQEIQHWWRQRMIPRRWETLRVCAAILATVHYASQPTPITFGLSSPSNLYPELQHAIQWLQAKTHRQVSMRNYLKEALQQEVACLQIQKWYRKHKQKRNLDFHRQQCQEPQNKENIRYLGALAIQDWWRALDLHKHAKQRAVFFLQRRERRASLLKMEETKRQQHQQLAQAAIVLQTWWRHCLMEQVLAAIGRLSIHDRETSSGALALDESPDDVSSIASGTTRNEAGESEAPPSDASSVDTRAIQSDVWWQVTVREMASTKLQKWVRQRLQMHRYGALVRSLMVMQHFCRDLARRKAARHKMKATIAGLCVIQRSFRAYCNRCDARKRVIAKMEAVALIQRIWMSYRTRNTSRQWRRAIFGGISKFQGRIRGILLRQQKHLCQMEATRIQSQWRRRSAFQQLHFRRSVLRFQAHWRRCLGQREASRRRLAAQEDKQCQSNAILAVISMQSHFRRLGAQREICHRRNGMRAIVRLQAHARRRASQKEGLRYQAVVKGIARFQAHFRRHQFQLVSILLRHRRSQLRQLLHLAYGQLLWINHNATILQSSFRRFSSMSCYKRHQSAAVRLQMQWRTFTKQRREDKQLESNAILAVISLQSHFRRLGVQREIGRCRNGMRAIVRLQAHARRRASQKEVSHYQAVIKGVARFQAHFRRRQFQLVSILLRHRRSQLQQLLHLAHGQLLWTNHSATVLQSNFRRFSARSCYKRNLSAAVSLQKWGRTFTKRRLNKNRLLIYRGVVRFQANFRRRQILLVHVLLQHQRKNRVKLLYQIQNRLLWSHHNATLLQARWRCLTCRRLYKLHKSRLVQLQACARRHTAWTKAQQLRRGGRASTSLQSVIRGFLGRRQWQRLLSSVVIIQSFWRSSWATLQYRNHLSSRVVIQRTVRCHLARLRLKLAEMGRRARLDTAATAIQGSWRGHAYREEQTKRRVAATMMQSCWRAYSGRVAYLAKVSGCICVQASVRRHVARQSVKMMREQRREHARFLRERNAATHIQRIYRGSSQHELYCLHIRAAVLLQASMRGYYARLRYAKQRSASVLLQSSERRRRSVRLYRALQDGRDQRHRREAASFEIQRVFRGHCVRNQLLIQVTSASFIQGCWRQRAGLLQQHRQSCVMIQSLARRRSSVMTMRRLRAKKVARLEQLVLQHAAVKVQCALRGFSIRIANRRHTESAIRVQALWRMYLVQSKWNDVLKFCCTLQAHTRRLIATKTLRLKLLSAISIQTWLRQSVAFNQYRQQRHSVQRMQAVVRGQVVRNAYRVANRAVVKLQKYWRMKNARSVYVSRRQAVRAVQKFVRARFDSRTTTRIESSWIRLQSLWRGWYARDSIVRKQRASVRIQAFSRRSLVQKSNALSCKAAITIQRFWRLRELLSPCGKQKDLAVLLQSIVRSHLARRRLGEMRSRCHLQAFARGALARQQYASTRIACILLQAGVRRNIGRSIYLQSRTSAILLQRVWRRLVCLLYYNQERAAIIKLQALSRLVNALKKFRVARSSAIKIQAGIHRAIHSKRYRLNLLSVLRVQAAVRRHLATKRLRQAKSLVVTLQATLRRKIALRRFRDNVNAGIRCQALWRSYASQAQLALTSRTTFQYLDRSSMATSELLHFSRCATVIQRFWRCQVDHCQAVSSIQRSKEQDYRSAVLLQRNSRRWLARRRLLDLIHSAVIVQSFGRLAAPRIYCRKARRSTILVQRLQRMRVARAFYRKKLRAASAIQVWLRARTCRQRYLRVRLYACVIQRFQRGFQTQRSYRSTLVSIVKVQSLIRALKYRQCYLNLQTVNRAATVIQCLVRGVACRGLIPSCRLAAVRVQSCTRKLIVQAHFKKATKSSVALQSAWRRCWMQQRLCHARASAMSIQAIYRGYRVRCWFCSLLHHSRQLQSVWRGHRARLCQHRQRPATPLAQNDSASDFDEGHQKRETGHLDASASIMDMAVVVQSTWRMFRRRTLYLRWRRSCLLLQAATRMESARGFFAKQKSAAVQVQTTWRNYHNHQAVAAGTIQGSWRAFVARITMGQSTSGAIKIQSMFKGYLARRHLRCEAFAARMIQHAWRDFRGRESLRVHVLTTRIQTQIRLRLAQQSFRSMQRSAAMIQAASRMARERSWFVDARNRCIEIQSIFRGMIVRRRIERLRLAVVYLQSNYRKQKSNSAYLQQRSLILAIQGCERNWIGLGRRRRLKHAAAFRIQKHWRMRKNGRGLRFPQQEAKFQSVLMTLGGTKSETVLPMKECILLQSWWRRHSQRQTFLKKKTAAWYVQRFVRRERANKLIQRHDVIVLQNCMFPRRIQKVFRGHTVRRHLCQQSSAAAAVQLWWRENLKNKRRQQGEQARIAAIRIQSRWRSYEARRVYAFVVFCAIRIQSDARTCLAMTRFAAARAAAVKLQRIIRYWLGQKRLVESLREEKEAAVTLQSVWRIFKERQVMHRQNQAATTVVQSYRSFVARARFEKVRRAFVVLQSTFRQRQIRRWLKRARSSAIAIQSRWRSALARRACRAVLGKRRSAASMIQVRLHAAFVRRDYLMQRYAAIKIQAMARKFSSNTVVATKRNAASTINRFMAIVSLRRRLRASLTSIHSHLHHLTVIQSRIRQHLVAKQDMLGLRRRAIVTIQSAMRRHAAIATYTSILQSHSSTIIQRQVRGCFVRRRDRLGASRDAACRIQKRVRGIVTRRKLKGKRRAALAIQCAWRAFDARALTVGLLSNRNCLVLQAVTRGWLVRRDGFLTGCKEACRRIQPNARGFLARNRVKKERASSIRIQSLYRLGRARDLAHIRRNAAALLRRSFRAILARAGVTRALSEQGARRQAATMIQCTIRRYLAQKQFFLVFGTFVRAVMAVQRVWRGFVGRAVFSYLQFQATILQSFVRMKTAQKHFLRRKSAAGLIASFARCISAKKKAADRFSRVIALQGVCRMLLARQEVANRKLKHSIERKGQLCKELYSYHSKKHYQDASRTAEDEVKLLLAGDRATLEVAGICLNRLVCRVTHFRFMVQTEANEAKEALDTLQSVKDDYSSYWL
jgi:IQ calmodulin-binding motif